MGVMAPYIVAIGCDAQLRPLIAVSASQTTEVPAAVCVAADVVSVSVPDNGFPGGGVLIGGGLQHDELVIPPALVPMGAGAAFELPDLTDPTRGYMLHPVLCINGNILACVLWSRADDRAAGDVAGDVLLGSGAVQSVLGSWPCDLDADGVAHIAALEADGGDLATGIVANWPSSWRLRLPGDNPDPLNPQTNSPANPSGTLFPGPPSGPRIVGAVLA